MKGDLASGNRPIDVAFITVNYNTRRLSEELVTFFRTTPLPFSHTLTIVDNASTDSSAEFLECLVTSGGKIGNKRESYGHVMQALKETKERKGSWETGPAKLS